MPELFDDLAAIGSTDSAARSGWRQAAHVIVVLAGFAALLSVMLLISL